MEISFENLRTLAEEAYGLGAQGCQELKSDDIENLLAKYKSHTEEFRIWTVAELDKMAVGTIFHHLKLGRCWIQENVGGHRYMQFQTGKSTYFVTNGDPWDKLMKIVR